MPVKLLNPYALPASAKSRGKKTRARWLRGNLHMHTTQSDGSREQQVVVDDYASRGYDFIMISDHDKVTPPSWVKHRGMVLIPGNEISARNVHMLHVNAQEKIEPVADRQKVIDTIRKHKDQFVIVNHPNWGRDYGHCSFEQIRAWQGYTGIEIYNGGVETAPGMAVSTDKWDAVLSSGRIVWGYANDDSHHDFEVERGWNMVLTGDKSVQGIVAALKAGRCYASTGVHIASIEVKGSVLKLHAPNAERINVISAFSEIIHTAHGSRLTFDATEVTNGYIRVECIGKKGTMAWTQPFALVGGQAGRRDRMLKERPVLNVLQVKSLPALGSDPKAGPWKQALQHGRFLSLQTGELAAQQSRVRCLSDGKSLLFGIDCDEPAMATLKCNVNSHGDPSVWADDSVELFIDPTGDAKSYWQIMVNANGFACPIRARKSATLRSLKTKATHSKTGWRVEILMSLAELGAPADLSTVRFNVGRTRCSEGRLKRANHTWKWVGETFHTPEHFGLLRFARSR